jgi:hypothetical protein
MAKPRPVAIALAVLVACAGAGRAAATQHLIRAGDDWTDIEARLRPGDEVILMGGRHRPAVLNDLRGSEDRPIVIRGLDPNDPPIIDANRYGIRINRPRFVHIRNLVIRGATINGITLDGALHPVTGADPGMTADVSGHVVISNVAIQNTGPRGLRHAIVLRRLDNVTIDSCHIEGWAGSAVEVTACNEVDIEDSVMIGQAEHDQLSGVRVRAGSFGVEIRGCTFRNTGDQGVCIGGGSKLADFREPPAADVEPGSLFEAEAVIVDRCVFFGSRCAVAFVNCHVATVRNCTIVAPTTAVVSVRAEQADPRFGAALRCQFGNNIVRWNPDELKSLTHLGRGANTAGVSLEQNLWWAPGWLEIQDDLGPFPGEAQFPQITDVDPELDDAGRPQAEAARILGAHMP